MHLPPCPHTFMVNMQRSVTSRLDDHMISGDLFSAHAANKLLLRRIVILLHRHPPYCCS